MRRFLFLFAILCTSCLVLITQLGVIQSLPFPLNRLNLFLVSILWLALMARTPTVLLSIVPATLFMELFSSAPFGAIFLSTFMSAIVVRWLLVTLFTNRSLWIVAVVGVVGQTLFQGGMLASLMVVPFRNSSVVFDTHFLAPAGWSILVNTLLLLLSYSISLRLVKNLSPTHITSRRLYV